MQPWLKLYPSEIQQQQPLKIPESPLYELLAQTAAKYPERVATVFYHKKTTYREIWERAQNLASALQAQGVKKGDRVALMLPNCPQAIYCFYGVLLTGAVVVEVNPLYTQRELRHQLADAGTRHIICLDLVYSKVFAVAQDVGLTHITVTRLTEVLPWPLTWLYPLKLRRQGVRASVSYGKHGQLLVQRLVELLRHRGTWQRPEIDPARDVALLQYTGGTTGLSKGAMLTHRNLMANIAQAKIWLYKFDATEQQRVLAVLPFFHVYGLTLLLNYGVAEGALLVLQPKFEVDETLKLIERYRVSLFPGAPPMYVAINNHPRVKEFDLSSIEACMSGAAPLPLEVQQTFERLTGGKLVEGYGLTEASPVTHSTLIWGKRVPGSIGVPWPGTDCKIVDSDNKKELPVGEIGELAVHGPQVMLGYWNRPEETREVLRDGWLYTGDMARMDEEGIFYIVDRKKDMIIAGGFNIYPREVEEVLFEHPAILEASVVGIKDAYRGETVKAFIVLKPGQSLTENELEKFCRERLAAYKIPKLIEFRDALPKSLAGKVIRRALRDQESSA